MRSSALDGCDDVLATAELEAYLDRQIAVAPDVKPSGLLGWASALRLQQTVDLLECPDGQMGGESVTLAVAEKLV